MVSFVFSEMCSLLLNIASLDGRYPVNESVSELPAEFFTKLREDLCSSSLSQSEVCLLFIYATLNACILGDRDA